MFGFSACYIVLLRRSQETRAYNASPINIPNQNLVNHSTEPKNFHILSPLILLFAEKTLSLSLALSFFSANFIICFSLMASASFVKINASAPQWIGQQSFSQRRGGSSARRVSASPIRASAYSDELVKTAVSIPLLCPNLSFSFFLFRFSTLELMFLI